VKRAAAVAACLAAAVVFHRELLFGGALSGRDWAIHYHYYDWIHLSLSRYATLPLFMADALHSPNFLANPQTPLLGPLVGLLFLMPTDAYIKLLIVLYTAAGLLGTYLLLRDLRVSAPLATLGSLAVVFNGYTVAHLAVGHHWTLGSQLLPALVLLFRRALAGSRGALVLAGALVALNLQEGQHHPYLWNQGFLLLLAGSISLRDRSVYPLAIAAAICALAAGLSGVRLVPMIAEFGAYAPTQRIPGIAPRPLLWSLVTPGPYADTNTGIAYAWGSGWWEYYFYLGATLLAALAIGAAVAAKRCWPLLAAAAPFALLALDLTGWHAALDPWRVLQDVPVVGSQRNPPRLMSVALFALAIAGCVGLQSIWERLRAHAFWRRVLPAAAVLFCAWTAFDLHRAALPWEISAVGAPLASRDHGLPLPSLRGDRHGTVAEADFAPNRPVFRVATTREARLVFPVRYARHRNDWFAEGFTSEAYGQSWALRLPPGERDVVMHFRPRLMRAGFALSVVTLLGLAATTLFAGRRSRSSDKKEMP
jgi:hypothetical protein